MAESLSRSQSQTDFASTLQPFFKDKELETFYAVCSTYKLRIAVITEKTKFRPNI